MKAHKQAVCVVGGGRGPEARASLVSAAQCARALDADAFDVLVAAIDRRGGWCLGRAVDEVIEHPDDIHRVGVRAQARVYELGRGGFSAGGRMEVPLDDDCVFLLCTIGMHGEDGELQGFLGTLGFAFTGPDVLGSAVCMSKTMTKDVLRAHGVPVLPDVRLVDDDGDYEALARSLGRKLCVKPVNSGSTLGVSVVEDADGFGSAVRHARAYGRQIMVEPYVVGYQVEIPVLRDSAGLRAGAPCVQNIAPGVFYTYDMKYASDSEVHGDVLTDGHVLAPHVERLEHLAARTYELLACGGLVRVDLFVDERGDAVVNEVNTIPFLSADSVPIRGFAARGWTFPQLLARMVAAALG